MKVTLIQVISLDGKITDGTDEYPFRWTSKEDAELFGAIKAQHDLVVMGYETFRIVRPPVKPGDPTLRIVYTNTPEKYVTEAIPGKLEFTNEPPKTLIRQLTQRGYKQMLLVGGSQINALFARAGCIDEIRVTIEPRILGKGLPMFAGEIPPMRLQLSESKRLNDTGTMHLSYHVRKEQQ